MGSLLSIGWYLLLGALAFASAENILAKFLGLYYPTTDIALLSCIVLLLLRGQGRLYQTTARRISLIVFGIGLCFFATSDFIFNVQQASNAYVEGTWVDLGWPFGLMIIGVAAYLRRFLPLTSSDMIEQRLRRRSELATFGPAQLITYILLGILLVVLLLNVLSTDKLQLSIRPVLLLATIAVVGLVVARQILTLLDNERLARRQANALERLEQANAKIEEQAHLASQRNDALAMGVLHLKDVQARLANGNLHARANLTGGELLPLAASLNLMAERLARMEQSEVYAKGLSDALVALSAAIDQYKRGKPFVLPPICRNFPEIQRLLLSLELQDRVRVSHVPTTPTPADGQQSIASRSVAQSPSVESRIQR